MATKSRIARKRRHQRIRMSISGTAERPRLNVFRSLEHIYAQLIDDVAGQTIVSASTVDKKLVAEMEGKNKKEQATLVGKTVAERALAAGIKQVVFDRGGYLYHGRVKALADGAREGGLEF
ncbi:MAG: 50S ribosomal protein L18 [Chloroflexota bacterium]|nr:50S ribosomal protein L18 [Anaerolineales bacterium]MCA9974194.1 50S ribosomal protein L18 [Anaerolineales bacterium]MCB8967547.1 50S ribosomal protein L18 [Ardenticatenaceae bacterium]